MNKEMMISGEEFSFPDYNTGSTTFMLDENCSILIGSNTASTVFTVPRSAFNYANQHYFHVKRNETLLVNAMRNMIRKSNFTELNEALDANELTEEEYNHNLGNETDKFAITIKEMEMPNDIYNIMELSQLIGYNLKDFTLSEISEMFSVNENDLMGSLEKQIPQLLV